MSSASRALRDWTGSHGDDDGERLVTFDDLSGSIPRADRLHLSEVVLLDRSEDDGPARCELVRLHASDVLTRLLQPTFNCEQLAHSVEVPARAAPTSRAWLLRYTDARAAVALLGKSSPPPAGSRRAHLQRGGTTA